MQSSAGKKWFGRTPSEWLSSLPIFSLLLLTLIIGTGEMVHGQLLRLGERMFGDPENQVQYFLLRAVFAELAHHHALDADGAQEIRSPTSAKTTRLSSR